MTREEAKSCIRRKMCENCGTYLGGGKCRDTCYVVEAIKALEQESCEMTAEEYRQRMIQVFHNAGTDELVAVCVLPTEKEFEHLEWLLKNHYKKSKRGHWRKVDTNMYACSNCSHVLTINPLDNSILEMNTCPFCSVNMIESKVES